MVDIQSLTEELTSALGQPGKFQLLLTLLLCLNNIVVCWNHLGMAFLAAKTKHHCSVKNSSDIDYLVPLVKRNGKEQWDGCKLYAGYNSSEKVECSSGWTYYLPDREQTVISEVKFCVIWYSAYLWCLVHFTTKCNIFFREKLHLHGLKDALFGC